MEDTCLETMGCGGIWLSAPIIPFIATSVVTAALPLLCDLSQVSSHLSTSLFSSVKWEY